MIKKIYHLADIHFRNVKRHKEYRLVLQQFLDNVDKDDIDDSIIYIGGDIAHAKTEMSPELVKEISWFLRECADRKPTIVITGNHDCFTGEHEVLTKDGWVRLDTYINSEMDLEVATFSEDTESIEFQKPIGRVKKPFSGKLKHIFGKNVDMKVTPTHNILYQYTQYPDKYYKKRADSINNNALIPISSKFDEDNFTDDYFAKLLGFSFADGTFVLKNENTGSCRIQFHLKKERKLKYLSEILDELDYEFSINESSEKDGGVYINIYSNLAKEIYSFFDGKKELSWDIVNKSKNFIFNFLTGYLNGDGSNSKNNFFRFVNKDKSNIEILTTISRIVGGNSNTHFDKELYGSFENSGRLYRGNISWGFDRNRSSIQDIEDDAFNGDVYCLAVPNSNLFIRNNDKMFITGNCNLNNSHRLDVLTPIVENLNHDNLYYYRDTGVYEFDNLTFAVYSILDDRENWPKGTDVKGDNKICLFHGPINKSKTDVGYTISSNKFTVDLFDGFDMALLGDIHSRQTVQEYMKIDNIKKPVVQYAGSCLQQNHGELLEGHGYLLWDIESRTFEEVDLHNDYGYLTIDVDNGEIPQWVYDEKDTKLPKHPRVRMRFKNTDPTQVKICVAELKQLFDISEVSITRTDTIGSLKQNNHLNSNIPGNINEISFQNTLIKEYLQRQFSLNTDDIDKIMDINEKVNNAVNKNEVSSNIVWIPKKFEFENMFSYGENNKIDFTNTRGIVGIFASNAAGKSSIFASLSFCLFDKSPRTHLSKHIINNKSKTFKCKFEFEINSVRYFIERRGEWVRNDTAVKVDVDFWKVVDGEKISLNGEQRRDTNKIIEKYIGTFDDFILTALSVQGNNALFIDKSQSERKEILSQFIGIDIFDKLYTVANDEHRSNASVIKDFKKNDFTSKLAELNTSLEEDEKQYDELSTEIDELEGKASKLNKKTVKLTSEIISLKNDDLHIDKLTEDKKKYVKLKEEHLEEQTELNDDLIVLLNETSILERELSKLDEESIVDNYKKYIDLKSKKSTINNKLEKIGIKLDSLQGQLDHLNEHEYDPDCEICMKNSKSIRKSKDEISKKISSLTESNEVLDELLEKVELELDELSDIEDLYEKLKSTKESMNENKSMIDENKRKLDKNKYEQEKIDSKVTETEKLINEYHKNESQIKKNNLTRQKIKEVEVELGEVKKIIKKKNTLLLETNGEISTINSKLEQLNESIERVKELENQARLYEYYLEAVGRNGIPYELIERALPMIEGEVNNILSQIVDFSMVINMDGKNIDSFIVYDDDKYWSLEMCSGMERFISGLAIRVALINICNLPRPNFLVIDEGFGTLDSDNLQSLFMLFNYLKTQFDYVMIISHIYTMRDVVDSLIDIKKVNGKSNVRY